jgi:hypothetical protein
MLDTKQEIQKEIAMLMKHIEIARESVDDFSKRHSKGVRGNALVHCLRRATDIAEGYVLVAEAGLPISLYVLTRSLYESLVWTRWIALSDENARIFTEAAVNEFKRIARKNLKAGHATIQRKTPQENITQEFLESSAMKGIPKRRRIEDLAKEAGLEKVHTIIYGFLSMSAHGTTFGWDEIANIDEDVLAAIASANALMECINLVVGGWVVGRKQTSISEIYSILGMQKEAA